MDFDLLTDVGGGFIFFSLIPQALKLRMEMRYLH